MNPVRRATPDSEAMASSEDEKPWPAQMAFGRFSMNDASVPGLPGGIWSTQKRGSFKMSEAAHRSAILEARLGAANPAHNVLGPGSTPSPSVSDGTGALPFAIPLQPTPKLGRSLSHSQGQRELPESSGTHSGTAQHTLALPLGLLAEEVDTDSESELGSRLTHTTSHPPVGSVMRTSTFPPAYDILNNASNGKNGTYDFLAAQHGAKLDRRPEAAFAEHSFDQAPQRRAQWQSSLGWDDVPNVNESRRHSLADIPTRRGSLVAGESGLLGRTLSGETVDSHAAHFQRFSPPDRSVDSNNSLSDITNMTRYNVPEMYRAPRLQLDDQERNARRDQQHIAGTGLQWGLNGGRPRKQLYIVSFKCSRVDVFYLLDNTGLTIREGDLVIVEADRGQDLGTVQHAKVSPEAARELKKKYHEEQYKWLMMYSRNKDGGTNPNAQAHGDSSSANDNNYPEAPQSISLPRDNNLKPKAIKRLAANHEIIKLADKEGQEAKAKRTCQQKVDHIRLEMEILDAEWQWDFQKLIFYYYADKYINFKDLVVELYRIYKTRIWLSAINPASFSQHVMGSPPSGIGPGAVAPYNPYSLNDSYTMSYGEDRDPYGAQRPYSIGYDTFTPNYPGIPGVVNSFAPGTLPTTQDVYYNGAPNNAATTHQDIQEIIAEPSTVISNATLDYNQAQSAWNGFSRRAPFPMPIGTRPGSHGNNESFSIHPTEQQRGFPFQPAQNGLRNHAQNISTYGGRKWGSTGVSNLGQFQTLAAQLDILKLDASEREKLESMHNRVSKRDH